MTLYPLKLSYIAKERIWGGPHLKTDYGKEADTDRLGETWELSVRPEEMCRVENGALAGMPLRAAILAMGQASVCPTYDGGHFPLLIKLIDAGDRLSVQVHPGDAYAAHVEHDMGKTEMWYVLSAEEGASLVYGLRPGCDKEDLARAVREGRTEEVLSHHPVHAGDVLFIPAGLVHAIGAGITVAEIQENSDLTYRLYDYDRRGADGKPRALHIARALDVLRPYTEEEIQAIRYEAADREEKADSACLAHCRHFRVYLRTIDGDAACRCGAESFHSLLCLDGNGRIIHNDVTYSAKKGDSWFLPAGMGSYRLTGQMRLLDTSL